MMVYAAISSEGKVCMDPARESLTSEYYTSLLNSAVEPVAKQLFPNGFLLQSYNSALLFTTTTRLLSRLQSAVVL